MGPLRTTDVIFVRSDRQRMTLIFGLVPEYEFRGNLREFIGFSVRAMRIYDLIPAP